MTGPVIYHLGEFPPNNKDIDWLQLAPLLGKANAALARYDGLVNNLPNAKTLLAPLMMQEAALSSRIEGTNISMSEALQIEAGRQDVSPEKREEAEEVTNYRSALDFAATKIREQPFSLHLIRQAHETLMQGVRGRHSHPGALRTGQNWVGPGGCSIEQAHFVPVPREHLQSGLDTWIKYADSDTEIDGLVQLALLHLEFEALHPFEDGNGRLGRMIIPLFLCYKGLLSEPGFYMSGYLEAHREDYVNKMRMASSHGDWTNWCAFFLQGIEEQAQYNQKRATEILELYRDMPRRLSELTHSQYAPQTTDFIFQHPIFFSKQFYRDSDVPNPTAYRILKLLRDERILVVLAKGSRAHPTLYAFRELLNAAEGQVIL